MKIVYNIAGLRHSGGMERVLTNKANYLSAHGAEVLIVTTDQCGEPNYFALAPEVRTIDLHIGYEENNGKSLPCKILSYSRKQRLHRRRLTRLLEDEKADIAISMFDNDVSFLWKIKDGSKKIAEIHFSRFKRLQYGRKGIWGLVDKMRSREDLKTARRYHRFVVLSEEDKGYWGDLHNIEVIPNARTFDPPQPAALENKRVIAVGRYNYQKGFDDLIEAWELVYRQHPDWTLHVFGDGELRNSLSKQVENSGLQHVVVLEQPVKDIGNEYLQSSILAMSSRYEGLPMTLLEGQSYGLPIVSYTCKCGPRDIVAEGENGFLVPEGNVDTLARQMMRLMVDADLRKKMGAAARISSERYSEAVIMQQWTSLFNEVLK